MKSVFFPGGILSSGHCNLLQSQQSSATVQMALITKDQKPLPID